MLNTMCPLAHTLRGLNGPLRLRFRPLSIAFQCRNSGIRTFKERASFKRPCLQILERKNGFPTFWCSQDRLLTDGCRLPVERLLRTSQCRLFHTTPTQKAVPPVLWIVLRPVINVAAALFGRQFKKFWRRLPQEKRDKIIARLKANKNKIAGLLSVLMLWVLLYILVHIEEVPFTKRKRFILFSQGDMRHLSDEAQKEIIETYKTQMVSHSNAQHRCVRRVMSQIMEANRKEIAESGVTSWQIYVIDEPAISNAMVLPNGTVFIFTGIMDVCSSDDELGTILAHEIAHVLLNHQGENISKEHALGVVFVLLISAIYAVLPDVAAVLSHFFASQTSNLLIRLPFSRLLETEADSVGLNLAAKACLDVREASVFWAKMSVREELGCAEKPLELLSSHPSHETRQKAIDELIPDALKLRESCKCRPVSLLDPRVKFNAHKKYLGEAQMKGCLSCDTIFSNYR